VSNRLFQILLIASTLALSWLAMMAVHEFGHVLHAWVSGGRVKRVVLHPLAISRTDVEPNPRPLFVVWGGPLWGSLLPLAAWGAIQRFKPARAWLPRFFAGFCLIANGAYLGAGAFYPVGDAADLLRHGGARWQLALFGLPAIAGGLYLWNGLGPHFGLGTGGAVDRRAAVVVAAALATAIIVMLVFDWRDM
jgi:hypothetical protein